MSNIIALTEDLHLILLYDLSISRLSTLRKCMNNPVIKKYATRKQ